MKCMIKVGSFFYIQSPYSANLFSDFCVNEMKTSWDSNYTCDSRMLDEKSGACSMLMNISFLRETRKAPVPTKREVPCEILTVFRASA